MAKELGWNRTTWILQRGIRRRLRLVRNDNGVWSSLPITGVVMRAVFVLAEVVEGAIIEPSDTEL